MKEFKFRYKTLGGEYIFKELNLPDDATQRIAYDKSWQDVFADDFLRTPTGNRVRADSLLKNTIAFIQRNCTLEDDS